MVKIEFIYMKNKYIIENDDINSIFQKYSSLINKYLNELLFYYKGKYLNIGKNILNFKNMQKIDELEINCYKCGNNKFIIMI